MVSHVGNPTWKDKKELTLWRFVLKREDWADLSISGYSPNLQIRFLTLPLQGWRSVQKCASVQFSSVTQSCPTLCDPMNCATPGLPVHHQLPEFTQIHVHQVSDAIQPSHPRLSPSPPAPNPSRHQGLFQ